MEYKIFEYDKEKFLINSLRLYGVVEYDSKMLDLENSPDDKLFIVTVNKEENNKDNFLYGLCLMKHRELFDIQSKVLYLVKEGIDKLSINNISNLPLYYLSDYKNIIVSPESFMKEKVMKDLPLEELRPKYILSQTREIIKNMRTNNFILDDNIDSEWFDEKISSFLGRILEYYINLGYHFYKSFKELTKENLNIDIQTYPDCIELKNIYKACNK